MAPACPHTLRLYRWALRQAARLPTDRGDLRGHYARLARSEINVRASERRPEVLYDLHERAGGQVAWVLAKYLGPTATPGPPWPWPAERVFEDAAARDHAGGAR